MSRSADGRFVSFFGDLHPSYFGNVVKALGSAKQGFPIVTEVLHQKSPASSDSDATFLARLNRDWRPTVHAVRRLTPTIVEVDRRAPAAARALPARAVLPPAELRGAERRRVARPRG